MTHPEPLVVRSLRHIQEQQGTTVDPFPFLLDGTTYTMAQEASWIDLRHYAVGRWDGTMGVFEFSRGASDGPKITVSISTPSSEGVQMIEWLGPGLIATSNDDASILLWRTAGGAWTDIEKYDRLSYDSSLGVANSATSFTEGATIYLVVGHANGYVTVWIGSLSSAFKLACSPVDLRSATPTNPWGLQNIRGVSMVAWPPSMGNGQVYTGSENGLICVVEVPTGKVLSKTVYHLGAQRGINAIAAVGNNLIVGNCAVGSADKNLWFYVLDRNTWTPTLRSSFNLVVDIGRPQTFNFDVSWCLFAQSGGNTQLGALASTEEGYLWLLKLNSDESMNIVGSQRITSPLGSALAINIRGQLAVSAYDLYNFQLAQPSLFNVDERHPERLTPEMVGIEVGGPGFERGFPDGAASAPVSI